jgi:hypothetical protein
MLCNCFDKTYKASQTKEQKIKQLGKCYEDVTSIYMLSEESTTLKSIIDKGGDDEKTLNEALVKILIAKCTVYKTIVNEKETPLVEPLPITSNAYFLDQTKMTPKKLKVKINDGQMRTWMAIDMKKSKIQIVYDIRYEFSKEEDAKNYYSAKLEFLSEKAPEVTNELKNLGVTESNVYSDNSGAAFGLDMKMKNYIFRIKNIVAKVFVSATGKATDAEMLQFAKDAIAKIKAVK